MLAKKILFKIIRTENERKEKEREREKRERHKNGERSLKLPLMRILMKS